MTPTTEFSTPGETDVVAVRRFAAPAALVWRAHTEPEQVRQWLAQPHSPMIVCEIDLRVGGRYRYAWSLPDGSAFGFTGTYVEVVPPRRLVSTEVYLPHVPEAGVSGTVPDQPGVEALNTLELEERDGATTLTMTMRYPSREVRDQVLATGMADGMSACLDLLERLLVQDTARA